MTKEDLEYIFKQQLDVGTKKLFFMLIDDNKKFIERHSSLDMEELLPMLDCFRYAGSDCGIPRFEK